MNQYSCITRVHSCVYLIHIYYVTIYVCSVYRRAFLNMSLFIHAAYLSLPWPVGGPPPQIELHACLALTGAGVLLLPIFLASAFLKLGNLANDGIKLGKHLTTCSKDPPFSLISGNADSGKCFFFDILLY